MHYLCVLCALLGSIRDQDQAVRLVYSTLLIAWQYTYVVLGLQWMALLVSAIVQESGPSKTTVCFGRGVCTCACVACVSGLYVQVCMCVCVYVCVYIGRGDRAGPLL